MSNETKMLWVALIILIAYMLIRACWELYRSQKESESVPVVPFKLSVTYYNGVENITDVHPAHSERQAQLILNSYTFAGIRQAYLCHASNGRVYMSMNANGHLRSVMTNARATN